MIFVNRRRIKQNSGIVKDPTKYWYIEKYVYGVLKETLEIPLSTSTTFGSIDSGYSDDTFYGWSVSSTSTTRTFTSTSSYKNTTTAVKNNLDSENTLKIYAIYKYTDEYGSTSSSEISSTNAETSIIVSSDGTATFSGYYHKVDPSNGNETKSEITLYNNWTDYYAKIDDVYVTGKVSNSTSISKSVTAGQIVIIKGYNGGSSNNFYVVSCAVPHYVPTTKYRVVAHGSYDFGTGGTTIPIN